MGKWEIKREVFDDVTPTGKKKSVLSDQSLSSLIELQKRRFLEKHPNLVEEFRSVHGEKYDYSLIDYVDSATPLEIICREHGQFKQTYWNHIMGRGCPSCGRDKSSKSRLLSTKQIISRFQKIHGNRYNYGRVNYINAKTKVEIVCPDHGPFFQFPYSHESGARCPKCANRTKKSGRLLALDEVLAQFRSIHGEKYDYTKCVYKGSTKPILIICPQHGEFIQKPSVHKLGCGCPECGKVNGRAPKLSTERVIQQFIGRFGDRYDYSKVVYRGCGEKILIGCPKHGEFSQTPSKHKSGRGCPACARENKCNQNKP